MTSASSTLSTTPDVQRLALKPDAPTTGVVDGAWWPASRDLAAELPSVAADLADRLGRVESVSYNLGAWETAPRKITVDGSAVRLAGYRTQAHDTVDLIGHRRRLTLLVVPPETDPQVAHDVLEAAAGEGNTDGTEALLHSGDREPTP